MFIVLKLFILMHSFNQAYHTYFTIQIWSIFNEYYLQQKNKEKIVTWNRKIYQKNKFSLHATKNFS